MEKLTTVVHVKTYAVTDIVTSSSISVGTGMVVSGTTISCHYTLFAAPLSTNSGIQAMQECVDVSHYVKNPRQRFDNLFSKVIKKEFFPCSSHFPSTKFVRQSACKARKSEGSFYLHSLALIQNRQSAYWRRKSFRLHNYEILQKKRHYLLTRAQVELAGGLEVINDLGLDTLTFLATTVLIVPTFKAIKASPILGFFISGVVLNQLGWIRNITDVKALSELGILFLLFEMGLELSLARLKALAKFAFGLGLAQVLFSTLAFTAFELPPNGAIGTKILEFLFHSRPDLVNIRSIDEAVVIGAALSMSSSAFVLQLLAERGELPTRFGSATLGILLFQDIAVVPLLVILPILESGNLGKESLWPLLAAESLKALGGLGALSIGGQLLIRRIFEVVADSRSSEAFNALCLLTVTGTSLLTQKLGFSDTLGAFLAGALLAETNFRTQIEADIRPFRGLLLGLFFVTTGTSIDIQLLIREWPNVLTLLGGLIAIKTIIITALGPRVGLSLPESVRIGLLLSQGGEFAFVVFSLANRLGVLPLELNRLLIIVVVLSMSLTPFLNELGRKVAESIEAHYETPQEDMNSTKSYNVSEPVVIIGFGQMGQVLANFLTFPFAAGLGGEAVGWPFVAFDLDPGIVKAARKLGFPVLYGDGSRPVVLQTAGIRMPKAVMIMYTGRQKAVQAVERLRLAFPGIPIYARAQDLGHLLELKKAGASDAILENTETSLQLGSVLLRGLGVMSDDVSFLTRIMRESMELRAREALEKKDGKEDDLLMPFQVKVRQKWNAGSQKEANMKEFDKLPPLNSYKLKKREGASSVIGLAVEGVGLQALEGNMPNEVPSSSNEIPGRSSEGENLLSSSIEVVESAGINLQQLQQSGTEPSGTDVPAEFTVASHWPNEAGTISTTNSVNGPERESSRSSTLKKSKLVWHGKHCHSQVDALDQDNRGVTWCALTDDDDSFHEELEEGELIERIDESIEYVSNMDRP